MNRIYISLLLLVVTLSVSATAFADIKVRQRVTMSGQSFESTRSIKGTRERTEQKYEGATAAYMPQIVNITQCDMKRTIRLNDNKKLYMIEPFAASADSAPAARTAAPSTTRTTTRAGGTMTITYSVRDTGERKMMFGLQARHLIITHEMESSADSCNGPSTMKMEYDGWYADFSADFNCPAAYAGYQQPYNPGKPDCTDKIITKGNANAARLGQLLEGTMKMFGKDGTVAMTSTTETLELSRAPLSASLFDIPGGYGLASSQQDLYAIDMSAMASAAANPGSSSSSSNRGGTAPSVAASSAKSVGVNITVAPGASANQAEIDQYIRGRIASRGLRAVSGSGDYTLNIQVSKVKESTAGKIGGMFGKVTGVPTGGIAKVDIEMTASLSGGSTGQARVKSKFDGPADSAVRAAIDQALDQVLSGVHE